MPMQNFIASKEQQALGVSPYRPFAFGRAGSIGCMPTQNFSPKALGVCPCNIDCFWQNRRQWAGVHAKSYCFGETGDIGCVPMPNVIALAELKA